MTLAKGGRVVRPGQVYGGIERGLFGLLCVLVRRLPVLPAFFPAPLVQPVHVDDLVDALLACPTLAPSTVLCVAAPEGIGFTALLQAIARGRTDRWHISIPVPTFLVRASANLLGSDLSGKFGLDRLLSLFALRHMDTADDLQRVSLVLRPLGAGMTRSGRGRRELLVEGRILLTYVLRGEPADALVRRYVRAVEALRKGIALPLPEPVQRMPVLLALLDGAGCMNVAYRRELDWRLEAALMLAEASPQGACRFLGVDKPGGWLRSALRISRAVLTEALRRTAQLILRPLLCRIGRRGVSLDDRKFSGRLRRDHRRKWTGRCFGGIPPR